MQNNIIGNYGEDLACKYLLQKGYRIVARNYRIGHLEIDIIAKSEGKLVFVEVKTRTGNYYGLAEEAVDINKTNRLMRAMSYYLQKYNIMDDNFRLDIIAIEIDKCKKTAKIKHFEKVF